MKNKITGFLLLSLLSILFMPPVFAVDQPAIQLYNECQKNIDANNNVNLTNNDEFQAGYCLGFIKGLDDLLYLHYAKIKLKGNRKIYLYCMPDGTTLNEMTTVFMNYVKQHPELNNEESGEIFVKALMEKYPCGVKHEN